MWQSVSAVSSLGHSYARMKFKVKLKTKGKHVTFDVLCYNCQLVVTSKLTLLWFEQIEHVALQCKVSLV